VTVTTLPSPPAAAAEVEAAGAAAWDEEAGALLDSSTGAGATEDEVVGSASEVDEDEGAGAGVDEVVVGSAAAATEVDDEARVDSLKRIGNEEVGQWKAGMAGVSSVYPG
jgi:hypothetical protein